MQWCAEKNAGFTSPKVRKPVRPVIGSGDYGNKAINVADQQREPNSLLNWMEHMLRVRKECPEFGWGELTVLKTRQESVLAHRCQWKNGAAIAVHNLANEKTTIAIKLEDGERLYELLGDRQKQDGPEAREVDLEAYGYRWFRVGGKQWLQP
jgi:maltose alpha-D-glucosyltransferase / alpha-amylase